MGTKINSINHLTLSYLITINKNNCLGIIIYQANNILYCIQIVKI